MAKAKRTFTESLQIQHRSKYGVLMMLRGAVYFLFGIGNVPVCFVENRCVEHLIIELEVQQEAKVHVRMPSSLVGKRRVS